MIERVAQSRTAEARRVERPRSVDFPSHTWKPMIVSTPASIATRGT
jgi:hypothetical protein